MNTEYQIFIESLPPTTLVLASGTHPEDLPSNETMTLKPEIAEWCDHCFSEPWLPVNYVIMLVPNAEYTVWVLETGCIEDATMFRLRWF